MKKKIAVGILIMLMAAGCGEKTEPVIRPVEAVSAVSAPEALVYEYPAVIMADKEAPLFIQSGRTYKNYECGSGNFCKRGRYYC